MLTPSQRAKARRDDEARAQRVRAAAQQVALDKAMAAQRQTGCTWADAKTVAGVQEDDSRPTSPGEKAPPTFLGPTGEGA